MVSFQQTMLRQKKKKNWKIIEMHTCTQIMRMRDGMVRMHSP
jgi:uncharacterized membrane protein